LTGFEATFFTRPAERAGREFSTLNPSKTERQFDQEICCAQTSHSFLEVWRELCALMRAEPERKSAEASEWKGFRWWSLERPAVTDNLKGCSFDKTSSLL